jgi:hypothetical protein
MKGIIFFIKKLFNGDNSVALALQELG